MDRAIEMDELVEQWTLLDDERDLLAGKGSAGRQARVRRRAEVLRSAWTRFPHGRSELADQMVRFVADQVGLPAWLVRVDRPHRRAPPLPGLSASRVPGVLNRGRRQARQRGWRARCEAERQHDVVREQLLIRCRGERVGPPTSGWIDRSVRSAMRQGEIALSCRIAGRLPASTTARLQDLVAVSVDDVDQYAGEESALAVPGRLVRRCRAEGAGRLTEPSGGGVAGGIEMFWPTDIAIERYRYPGHQDSLAQALVLVTARRWLIVKPISGRIRDHRPAP